MIYPIIAYGDSILKQVTEDIDQSGNIDVKEVSKNMFETMYNAEGVGLAGPQVGLGLRIFIVDTNQIEEENFKGFKKVFINATMEEEEGQEEGFEEGCLSIPSIRAKVFRQPKIKIHYFDENWAEHEEIYEGLAARVIQHEYDHVEGILFTDHISPLKKRLIEKN